MPRATAEAQREYQRLWIARRRAEWFSDKVCVICGSTDRLELDHIDPKTKVQSAIWSWTKTRREAELAKCQALCHDHHVEKTGQDRLALVEHGSYTMRYKLGCTCESCKSYSRNQKRRLRAR